MPATERSPLYQIPHTGHKEIEDLHFRKPAESKRRIDVLSIILNVLFPWALFVTLFSLASFELRFMYPRLALLLGIVCWSIVIMIILRAVRQRSPLPGNAMRRKWQVFTALLYFLAALAGTVLGEENYWHNMNPYYDYQSLITYVNINPSLDRGQSYMDSGEVYFKEHSRVDVAHAVAFQHKEIYCVAPITITPIVGSDTEDSSVPPPASGTIDFWAVGVNCCDSNGEDFNCADARDMHARAGLRLLRDDQRPYFKMAVEEWEARNNIRAVHPIFLFWLVDPLDETMKYLRNGQQIYLLCMMGYFVLNLGFTTAGSVLIK